MAATEASLAEDQDEHGQSLPSQERRQQKELIARRLLSSTPWLLPMADWIDLAVSPSAQRVGKSSCAAMQPNHYAVVTLDSAGLQLRGWDFKTLDQARTFGEQLRLKGLRVEVWARDEYGRRLARILARPVDNSKCS